MQQITVKEALEEEEQQTREEHERACVVSGDNGPRSSSTHGFCSFRDEERAAFQQHQGVSALPCVGLAVLAGKSVPDRPGRRRQRGQSLASFGVRWRAQPRRLWTLLHKLSYQTHHQVRLLLPGLMLCTRENSRQIIFETGSFT